MPACGEARQDAHQVECRARSLCHNVTVPCLPRREVSNDVEALGGGPEIRVGERAAIGHAKVGARHFDDDDPYLLLARGDLRRGEVSGSHVVVVPEAQIDDLVAREQLPHLRREDPEVCPRIGRGLGTGVPRQDVQDARAELAVLILLTPDARRQVHQRCEGAVGAADRPHAGELVGVERRALAHETDRARHVSRFLNSRLEPRSQRIGLGIVVAPDAAVLQIDRFRQIRGQRQHAIVRDVIQPLDHFGDAPAGSRHLAGLLEQRDLQLLFGARDRIPHRERLRLLRKVGDAETIVEERIVLHVGAEREIVLDGISDLNEPIGQPVPEAVLDRARTWRRRCSS